ncbi:phage regulatory protein/antirepressor Ant [Gluconobacter cerinus]|uniref:Phage associated-antirepressor BRO n=1 Tax=Gluconobacter cerinus TaxID=38307 RepID=A0A1B6VKL9_9PROT|nr:phage regulatory protein/antirepressor Ant [Gluconobacter cerinus]OAJ67763.1 phage associated-antirepressor BRO [Gluconobacter cerinus]
MSASLANIAVTMSSREIAELTGKEHKHVRRDVTKMLTELGINEKGYVQTWTDPQNGQEYEEFLLPKDLTITLVAGYRSDLRLKIIRRWMELEATPTFKAPTNMREALMLALDQQEEIERQKALIDAAVPKVAALDRIAVSSGEYGLTETAKILQLKPAKFFDWLDQNRCRYGRGKVKLAYQDKIDAGYFRNKATQYTDPNGEPQAGNTIRVTPKGLAWLAKVVPGARVETETTCAAVVHPQAEMIYVPLDTAERRSERATTKARFIVSDPILMVAMDRWEAMRWSGIPQSQEDADMWYEINDYTPKTPYARQRKERFMGLFSYTALKRSTSPA